MSPASLKQENLSSNLSALQNGHIVSCEQWFRSVVTSIATAQSFVSNLEELYGLRANHKLRVVARVGTPKRQRPSDDPNYSGRVVAKMDRPPTAKSSFAFKDVEGIGWVSYDKVTIVGEANSSGKNSS